MPHVEDLVDRRHLIHFYHYNIRKYCNRPYDHNQRMWYALELCVGPNDTLIHMGDLCFSSPWRTKKIFERLPGFKKILVEGNHDKRSGAIKCPWDIIIRKCKQPYLFEYQGIQIYLAHTPTKHNFPDGSIYIHAHSHEKGIPVRWDGNTLIIHSSVEQWDYWPINLNKIIGLKQNANKAI